MSTIVAQGSLRVSLPLDQLLHNLSTFTSSFKAFSLLAFIMRTSPPQEIQVLKVKIIEKSFSSASKGLQEAVTMALNCRSSKIQFMSLKGDILWDDGDISNGWGTLQSYESRFVLPLGSWKPPPCYIIYFGLYSQAASLYGFLDFCFLVNNPNSKTSWRSLDFPLWVRRSGLLYQANCWPNNKVQRAAGFEAAVTILTLSWELAH